MSDQIIETVNNGDGEPVTITTTRWTIAGQPEPRDEWFARHQAAVDAVT